MARFLSGLVAGLLLAAFAWILLQSPTEEAELPLSRRPDPSPEVRENRPAPMAEAPVHTRESMPSTADEKKPEVLLYSSSRMDQLQAIEILKARGTEDAAKILLQQFLATDDSLLAGLIEEALLELPFDFSPALMDAFRATAHGPKAEQLAKMLNAMAGRHPASEERILALYLETLQDPGPSPERRQIAAGGLAGFGLRALDRVAEFLADPNADPGGAQSAAWVLTQMESHHAPEVEAKIQETLARLLEDSGQAENLKGIRDKTRAIVWAATNRPAEEQDRLGNLLYQNMLKATDKVQAQSLGWGLVNLQEQSDRARVDHAARLLDSIQNAEGELKNSFAWTVANLATHYGNRPPDDNFHQIRTLTQERLQDPQLSSGDRPKLEWILEQLDLHRVKHRGF